MTEHIVLSRWWRKWLGAIPPAEGIVYQSLMSGFGDRMLPMVGVVLRLDDDDLERIIDGDRHILMSWHGRTMPVFVVPELLNEGRSL